MPPPPGSNPSFTSGWPNFARLRGDADGASHRRLAAAAERKAVDRRDHRLAEILDEIEDALSVSGLTAPLRRRSLASSLMSAPAMNALSPAPVRMTPRTAASFCASSKAVAQVLPCRLVQGVEHLGPVERHIGDRALLLVQDIRKRQRWRWRVLESV